MFTTQQLVQVLHLAGAYRAAHQINWVRNELDVVELSEMHMHSLAKSFTSAFEHVPVNTHKPLVELLPYIMTESEYEYEVGELELSYQMDIKTKDQALHLFIANNVIDLTQDDERNWYVMYKDRKILSGNY